MAKLLTGTRIYGTGTVDTQLFVNGTEQAVSTTTGALEVIGGAGIGGNLHLGGISVSAGVQTTNIVASGTLGVTGTTTLTVLNATSATFSGTLGVTGTSVLNGLQASNIVASGTLGVTGTSTLAGITLVTNTTSATSITTGALVVSGGVGIGQDLRVGGVIYGTFNGAVTGTATNAINISGGTVGQVPYQTAPGTTSFYGPGTAGNVLVSNGAAAPSYNNTLTLTGTTAATSTATGALQVRGGVGVGGVIWASSGGAGGIRTPNGSIYDDGNFHVHGLAGNLWLNATAAGGVVSINNQYSGNVVITNGVGNVQIVSTQSAISTTTGALQVIGGVGIGGSLFVRDNIVQVGGTHSTLAATYNLINTTATTVNFAGAATSLNVGATSGSTNVRNNLIISGNLTVQGTTTIVDSTVTNIADPIITLGGGSGNNNPTTDDNKDRGIAFKWVNNGGTTSTGFFGYDDSTGHLTYIQTATITNEVVSGTKGAVDANLAGGTAMSLVYQSAVNTTAFLAAGSSGFILQTNGTSAAPTWVSAAGIGAGSATNSDAIRTIERTTNASHFLTFVDSNNATNAYESLYTTSSFVINPRSGNVGIGTTSPAAKLDLYNAADAGSAANGIRVQRPASYGQYGYLEYLVSSDVTVLGSLYTGGTAASYGQIYFRQHSNGGAITDAMVINGSNNVGIGTTTPATKLAVAGTIGFTVGSAAGIIRRTTVNGSNGIRIQGNASDTINTDAAAGAYITVGGGVIGDTFEGNIDIVAYGGNVDANRNQIRFSNRSGANAITERMRIDKDGNVGIGTAAPGARLDIQANDGGDTRSIQTVLPPSASYNPPASNTPGKVVAGIKFNWYSANWQIGAARSGGTDVDGFVISRNNTSTVAITANGALAFGLPTAYGSNGQVLRSNGDAAPTWVNPSTLASGSATNADNISTVARTTNASHFLTFVDSNNASNAYEPLYTTSSFTINPQSGFLTVANTARIGATVAQGDPSTTDITANATLLLSGVGGNYLAFGQKASNLAQWIQSSYSTPTTAVYPISLNPLGGNVGIGTISPTAKLQVELSGTVSLAAATIVKSTDFGADSRAGFPGLANNSDGIYFGMGANGTGIPAGFGFFREASGWNTALAFYTNNVTSGPNSTAAMQEKMRITSGGGIAFGGASNYGSAGQILQSNGDAAPTWVALSGRTVGTSTQVTTVARTTNASHFLTFVDSNNASATAESLYTTSSFSINPQSGNVSIGGRTEGIWLGDIGNNSAYDNVKIYYTGYNGGAPQVILQPRTTPGSGVVATAFYFKNSNGSSLASNNRADVYVDGNVGIGTSSPANKLDVRGTLGIGTAGTAALNSLVISSVNNSAQNHTHTFAGPAAGTNDDLIFDLSRSGGAYGSFVVRINGGNLLYLTSGGLANSGNSYLLPANNFGIGTTAPATKLSVGSASHTSPGDTNRILNWYGTSGGSELHNSVHSITAGNDSAETAQPQQVGLSLFNVNATNNIWSPAITFGGRSTSGNYMNGAAAIAAKLPTNADDNNFRGGDIHFFTQGTTTAGRGLTSKMVLSANGNVSIGTTSTTNKFEVVGTAGQLFSVSDSFTGTIFSANDVSGIPSIEVLDTGLVKLAQYNGAVAIGTGTITSSTAELSVYGMLYTLGSQGEIRASSEITAYFSSDARLKENIKLIENPITIIDQIRGVTFDWTDEHMARRGGEDGYFVRKHDIGVIAQEVQAVLPELVGTREDGYLAVKYEKLVPLLIEAIKAQQKTIDSLINDLAEVKEFISQTKNNK